MKKIFLAITILFVAVSCNTINEFPSSNFNCDVPPYEFSSRTFECEAVDSWGDKDGTINFGVLCEGYFSNNETDGDVASLKIVGNSNDDCIILIMKEYNIKTSNAIKGFEFINEKGDLLFSASTIITRETKTNVTINYNDLICFLRDSKTIKVFLYGNSSTYAYFKIDNPKEFTELIEKYEDIKPKKEEKRVDDTYWQSVNWHKINAIR